MPHSAHWSISTVLEHVVRADPRSVMDVGCGYGKWGYLIREALDFVYDRHRRDQWNVRIDGIDAFQPDTPLLDWVYDDVVVADVLTAPCDGYDFVVLGDVIEHIDKLHGRNLLDRLIARNGCVVVCTPREFFEQGDIGGNPFERHRSLWSASEFARWPADIDVRGGSLIAALRGASGFYPSLQTVRASTLVQRIPVLRGRGMASSALKRALLESSLRFHL